MAFKIKVKDDEIIQTPFSLATEYDYLISSDVDDGITYYKAVDAYGKIAFGGKYNKGLSTGNSTNLQLVVQAAINALEALTPEGGYILLKNLALPSGLSYDNSVLICVNYQGERRFYRNGVLLSDVGDIYVPPEGAFEKGYYYIVAFDGVNYKAINGITGNVDSVDTNPVTVVQYGIDNTPNGYNILVKDPISISESLVINNRQFLGFEFNTIAITANLPAIIVTGRYNDVGVRIEGKWVYETPATYSAALITILACNVHVNIDLLSVANAAVTTGSKGVLITSTDPDNGAYYNYVKISAISGFDVGVHLISTAGINTTHNKIQIGLISNGARAATGVKFEEIAGVGSFCSNNLAEFTLYDGGYDGDIAFWNSALGANSGNELRSCQSADVNGSSSFNIWNSGRLRVYGGDLGDPTLINNTGTLYFSDTLDGSGKLHGGAQWQNSDVWLVSDLGRSTALGATVLDCSAISPTLRRVTLQVKVIPNTVGDGNYCYIQFQQNGTNGNEPHIPFVLITKPSIATGTPIYAQVQCGVDASGKISYSIQFSGTGWNIDTYISVTGFDD